MSTSSPGIMLRRIVGPIIALGGIVLFGYGLFEYCLVPSVKVTFVDLFHGTVMTAMLIGVGVSWSKGKVQGRPTTDEHFRRGGGPGHDQST